jgi:hypothetical protein
MTLNVYVGANVDRVLAIQDLAQLPRLVADVFRELLTTNFPERAAAIADEIAGTRAQLIGLQEVSLIRLQPPRAITEDGGVSAASVVFDYLAILLSALVARGLDYRVAGVVQHIDIAVPMLAAGTPSDPFAYTDIRLTDFDVILARGDVGVTNVVTVNY